MKILIVEDDMVSTLVLRKSLEKMGYEVTMASNGAEAWDKLQSDAFRLVVTDWMMPEVDGVELCRRIRTLHGYPYTYVILLTSKDRREDRLEGLKAGADDFLIKPLDAGELAARLDVARRILSMQEEIATRSLQLEKLYTELERQNAQLAEAITYMEIANHRFEELFMGLPIACFTYDHNGRIRDWNRACEQLYGLKAEEVFEQTIWDTVARLEDGDKMRMMIDRVFSGEHIEGLEREDRRRDGSTFFVLCNTFPLRGPDGIVVGAISANVDITERKILEKLGLVKGARQASGGE